MKLSKDYKVSGNGVASRTAESYLRDPKVKKFLKKNIEEPGGILCGYYVEQDKEPLSAKYKGEGAYESSNQDS